MASQIQAPADPLEPARALFAERRPAEALMIVETLLARSPGDAAAAQLRQELVAAISAMDPLLAKLELTCAIHPEAPEHHYELGHAYVGLDRPADAERCFKRMLQLAPHSADGCASLGALYLSVDIRDGAEHFARRALGIDPAHVVASQTLATILEDRGDEEAARAQMARAYGRQALFRLDAPEPRLRVLVLATETAGNIPYRHVMPPRSYSRLVWYMEHARDAETPAPADYDLAFNAIGDADLAEAAAPAVRRFLAACPKPALNDPDAVARTRRDRLAELLAGLPDVVVPRTLRIAAAELADEPLGAVAARHGLTGELLLRPAGSHGGKGLQRAAGAAALDALEIAPGLDHYLTAFVDFASADGLYRKHRMFFVDGAAMPYHLAVAEHWLVHHESAGMGAHPDRRAEELRFLADPQGALGARGLAAVRAIGERLGLDYCGVDFAILPSGEVLVFEANATMLCHYEDPHGPYAGKNPHVQAIAEAFQRLLVERAGV